MRVENVKISDLEESFKASKYPMAVDTEKCTSVYTKRIEILGNSKLGHNQFLTGITVSFDLTCSNKMWIEAERYRFLNFVSSQSTMHRISKLEISQQCNEYVDESQFLSLCRFGRSKMYCGILMNIISLLLQFMVKLSKMKMADIIQQVFIGQAVCSVATGCI